jgi:sulfatase modifying factor 1
MSHQLTQRCDYLTKLSDLPWSISWANVLSMCNAIRSFLFTAFIALVLTSHLFAEPLVKIETVAVGNHGNLPDKLEAQTDGTRGYGSVSYPYSIGKCEVTIGQYAACLNAVARLSSGIAAQSMWQSDMEYDTWANGISRSGNGSLNQPYSYSVIGDGNRPITWVDWFDAARFCNWLHNGATVDADTETGAYTLNGATNGIISRNPDAKWWVPSENEWYKAAYYDPTRKSKTRYWAYPNRGDFMQAGEGNFYFGGYAYLGPGDNKLSPVGYYSNVATYYGTFDQAGNVWEWNDSLISAGMKGIRGGGWPSTDLGDPDVRHASFRDRGRLPTETGSYLGFRVTGLSQVLKVLPTKRTVSAGATVFLQLVITATPYPQSRSVPVSIKSSNPYVEAPSVVDVMIPARKSAKQRSTVVRHKFSVRVLAGAVGSISIAASIDQPMSVGTSTLVVKPPKGL